MAGGRAHRLGPAACLPQPGAVRCRPGKPARSVARQFPPRPRRLGAQPGAGVAAAEHWRLAAGGDGAARGGRQRAAVGLAGRSQALRCGAIDALCCSQLRCIQTYESTRRIGHATTKVPFTLVRTRSQQFLHDTGRLPSCTRRAARSPSPPAALEHSGCKVSDLRVHGCQTCESIQRIAHATSLCAG